MSGRGNSPYVPAPALTPLPGEQPGGGLYPNSPAARATVTPPGPEDTTSWPGPAEEQGKFDQFKASSEPAATPAPAKAHVRTVPVALAVVLGAAIILGMVFGLVWLIAGDDEFSVSEGQCVKRNGSTPLVADCKEADTFTVVSIQTEKSKCGDATQPYIVVPKDSGDQVLCLKKNG
ncbi:LppU/SCO3897 family protein [Actinoplanes utahensis]|uniref:LppU/SCO3897 family protein n=1 Tax=Actinoplanes utahensis TaxID=1869 RepID=UPI000A9011B8